jgi:GH25 family lysozyme M1 (1,4-beta-N-acetylmuramidase)
MTLHYPDISNFQGAISLAGVPAVAILVTHDTDFVNPRLAAQLAAASRAGAFTFGYHFLQQGSAAAQARWYHAHSSMPCMIDAEPYITDSVKSRPTLDDVTGFAAELRSLGGQTWICYLPRWYWTEMGSPSLAPVSQARLHLVSSDYTAYSDTGPGWAPYGGMTPVIWQHTDAQVLNGVKCDFNAFRGTLAELKEIIMGTPAAPKPAPAPAPKHAAPDTLERSVTAKLSWASVAGVPGYHLQVLDDASTVVLDTQVPATETSVTVTVPFARTLKWRVSASAEGAWSGFQSLTGKQAP